MDESTPEVEPSESGSEVQTVDTAIYNAVLQAMGIEDPAAWIDENVTYKRDGTPVITVPTPTPAPEVSPKPEGAGASASPAPSPSPIVRKRPVAASAASAGAVVGADIG